MFRQKNSSRTACERHAFSLRPRNDYVLHPQKLAASFCREDWPREGRGRSQDCSRSRSNCATFNSDGNYASPAFILRSQRKHYQQHGREMQADHDGKYLQYSDEKTELHLPEPKSRNNYCSVCHLNYENYLQHVENPFHLDKARKSPSNRHILELAELFRQRIKRETSSQGERTVLEISDSDEVEIIENPRKMIKDDHIATASNPTPSSLLQNTTQTLAWFGQNPLTYAKELTNFYQQQLAASHFLSFFTHSFPLISPHFHPIQTQTQIHIQMQNLFPFPLFNPTPTPSALPLPLPPRQSPPPKQIPCIVIEDDSLPLTMDAHSLRLYKN